MRKIMMICGLTIASVCGSANADEVNATCAPKAASQQSAMADFKQKMDQFNESNPPDDGFKPQACAGGDIRWQPTSWKMDVPEFTTKRMSWKMDVPETSMERQEWSFKKPVMICENKKVGQYPEFKCTDTWIKLPFGGKTKGVPKCTTSFSDIITKVCWPETRDETVSLDVPEFSMKTREFSMDVPQVTMKTREMSLHLPQFYMSSGCVGADCSDKCQAEMDAHTAESSSKRDSFMLTAKQQLLASTSDIFNCNSDALIAQKSFALAEYDKYIAVAQSTLDAMVAQGLAEAATSQVTQIEEMKRMRKEIMEQMDKALVELQNSEREALEKLGGGSV